MKKHLNLFLAAVFFAAPAALALCPHEVAVIVNDESADSVLVGRAFQDLRSIPEQNLVRLSVPTNLVAKGILSTDQFTQLVYEPVLAALKERGINSHILVWAYSTDFPVRISTSPEMSLTGLTFTRNTPYTGDLLKSGAYDSPIYACSETNAPAEAPKSRTFDAMRAVCLEDMPLPAMCLGVTGERGNTVDEILDCLERSAAADDERAAKRETGLSKARFVISVNDDVRTTAREWEFPDTKEAVAALGAKLDIVQNIPTGKPLAGFMGGFRELSEKTKPSFLPGAFADHFTSFAAAFHIDSQMKLSRWIRLGATATAGTVTEPFAFWQKFPHAGLFRHQLEGCTMAEAIYQSVKCPLQLLPVGDPLSSPYAVRPVIHVVLPSPSPLSGVVKISAEASDAEIFTRFNWLLDGKLLDASGASFLLDTRLYEDGDHVLRAIARSRTPVRHSGFSDILVTFQNK